MKCLLLDTEMPVGKVCPVPYNDEGLICHEDCGCADNPELLDEKAKNWEKFKAGMNLGINADKKK